MTMNFTIQFFGCMETNFPFFVHFKPAGLEFPLFSVAFSFESRGRKMTQHRMVLDPSLFKLSAYSVTVASLGVSRGNTVVDPQWA